MIFATLKVFKFVDYFESIFQYKNQHNQSCWEIFLHIVYKILSIKIIFYLKKNVLNCLTFGTENLYLQYVVLCIQIEFILKFNIIFSSKMSLNFNESYYFFLKIVLKCFCKSIWTNFQSFIWKIIRWKNKRMCKLQ